MKIIKKYISILLTVSVMASFGTTITYAESYATDDNCKIAMAVKEEFNKDVQTNMTLKDAPTKEFIERSSAANNCYNTIIEHIYNKDDELRRHFSGAFINDTGNLVILLCCNSSACKEQIIAETGYTDAIFNDGKGSYYDTMDALDSINHRIYLAQEDVKTGNADNSSIEMMKMFPRTEYDEHTNTISVLIDVEPEMLSYLSNFEISNGFNNNQIPKNLQQKAEKYNASVSLMKNSIIGLVPDTVSIKVDLSTGYEPDIEETVEWRPGRYIFVIASGATMGSECSTGYRAKYTYSGSTNYGFVTCAHGNSVGYSVYISTSISSANKLGTILNRSFGGTLDVAFIKMTNGNYTNGNAPYYTSSQSGVTRPGAVLDGTQTDVALNNTIYKSGQRTFLTWGYVENTNATGYIDDVYFYNRIRADRAMSNTGDSGAVTYVMSGTSFYAKAVGILQGKSLGKTVFIKASSIKSSFGAEAY